MTQSVIHQRHALRRLDVESLEILSGGSAEPETQIIEELKPISMVETTEMVDSAEPQVFKSKKGKKKCTKNYVSLVAFQSMQVFGLFRSKV
ncbi:MAG: hypothetical protein U0T36_03230 [Saprospiraceae bacterium]